MNSTPARSGPRTRKGKSIVRMNAIKHGILANIVPEHEKDAYNAHVAAVHAAYAPAGYLEEALTERISTSLWRLGRVVRHETSLVTGRTASELRDLHNPAATSSAALFNSNNPPPWPEDLQTQVDTLHQGMTVHERGPEAFEKATSAELHAWALAVAEYAQTVHDAEDYWKINGKVDRMHGIKPDDEHGWQTLEEEEGISLEWTPQNAQKAAELLLSSRGDPVRLPRDWRRVGEHLEWRSRLLALELGNVRQQHALLQAKAAVPSGPDAAKIAKYEAHLERTLYRAMHELEAMQERRAGKASPLARIEIHGGE